MISLRRKKPDIRRPLYWYFCLTSHFGTGHFEVAFYKRGQTITVYGVRNIARSNASRLGFSKIADGLRLAARAEEKLILQEIAGLLAEHGFRLRLAGAEECVALSVSGSLLHGSKAQEVRDGLTRKYRRLRRELKGVC